MEEKFGKCKTSFTSPPPLLCQCQSLSYESGPSITSPFRWFSWAPPADWQQQQLLRAALSEEQRQELQQELACGLMALMVPMSSLEISLSLQLRWQVQLQPSVCVSPALRDSPHWYQPKEQEKSTASCSFSGGTLTQTREGAALCNQPALIYLGDASEAFPDQSLVSHEETMQLLPKGAVCLQLLLQPQLCLRHNPIKTCSFP